MKEHKYNNIHINQSLIGRKVRGFRFEDGTNGLNWLRVMEDFIEEVGVITIQDNTTICIEFKDDAWSYPISLVHKHLVEEETSGLKRDTSEQNVDTSFTSYHQDLFDYLVNELNVTALESNLFDIERIVLNNQPSPQIKDLSNFEGVEMMVSDDTHNWKLKKIVAKNKSWYYDFDGAIWGFANPIEVKKVTMQEVEEKFGCKVEIVKEVSNEQ